MVGGQDMDSKIPNGKDLVKGVIELSETTFQGRVII